MRKTLLALGLLTIWMPTSWAVGFVYSDYWDLDDDDFSSDWSFPSAWESGIIPTTDGTANVFFGSTLIAGEEADFEDNAFSVGLESSLDVNSITFGPESIYSFYSSLYGASITVRDFVQLIGGEYGSEVYFGSGLEIFLTGDVEFNLGYGTEIEFEGTVNMDSTQTTTVDGGGTLLLAGDNSATLDGRIQVLDGTLGFAHDEGAGTAVIELGDAESPRSNFPALVAVDDDRSIDNNIIVNGLLRTFEDYGDENELTLAGQVSLNGDTRIENFGGLLSFDGSIVESNPGVKVTLNAAEPVIFRGMTGFTGGLDVEEGVVIFADINALPSSTVPLPADTVEGTLGALSIEALSGSFFTASSTDSYIGLLIDSATDRLAATAAFLDLFSPTEFNGTIGFDTDPSLTSQINEYTGPIDLSGMSASRIGSVTTANLTGTITPSGTDYQFGNGGGTLLVGSLLANDGINEVSRGLQVESTFDDPLTVYINNSANSFSGQASSQHSALIFGNAPGTLPTATTLRPLEGGYIGIQDTMRSIADYISQFDKTISTGFIGLDSQDRETNRVISDNIDLSAFSSTTPDFFLATSTWVNLGGVITLPPNATKYRFAGYKGGFLNVTSTLTNGDGDNIRGVQIGDKNVHGTFGVEFPSGDERESAVRLEGVNTYSGGTLLSAGQLVITNNASLGTGTLEIAGNETGFTDLAMYGFHFGEVGDDRAPALYSDTANLELTNPVEVNGFFDIDVPIHETDHNLSLVGNITGPGGINKNGQGTLNISGTNSGFTGGLYISEGTVNINSDTGAGTGPVGFGSEDSEEGGNQVLNFNSSNPTIGGLYRIKDDEDGDYTSSTNTPTVNLANGTMLTINIVNLNLDFDGMIQGDGGLEITGSGTQGLAGNNSFTGGLSVGVGSTLRADSNSSLGGNSSTPPSITLNGGSLQLDGDDESSVRANITFGASGGKITGNGTLNFDNTLTIGGSTSISPGNSIGGITFSGALEFGELGSLDIEIGEDGMSDLVADSVFTQQLNIAATNANPFSINLGAENSVVPTSFDSTQVESWNIVTSENSFTNFDISKFNLNVSSELQTAGGLGLWSMALGSGSSVLTNNLLTVNFTPVPEPSTVLLFGLGMVLLGCRRRRSA